MLREILDQEISPELVPVAEGERPQSTEDAIGPYALQDFTLFHVLRYGFPPSRIAFLARHAWSDADAGDWPPGFDADRRTAYDLATIRHWLEVFVQRFFAFSQFKRSALPNGPKVVAGGSLSPRGDWRAPSDGNARSGSTSCAATSPRAEPDRGSTPGASDGTVGGHCRRRTGDAPTWRTPRSSDACDRIVRRSGIRPQRVLEVGGYVDDEVAAAVPRQVRRAERWCINLVEQPDRDRHQARRRQLQRHAHVQGQLVRPGDVVRRARARPEVLALDRGDAPGAAARWPAGDLRAGLRQATDRPRAVHRRPSTCTTASTTTGSAGGRSARCSSRASSGSRCVSVLDPPRIIGHGFKPINRRQHAVRAARRTASALRRQAAVRRRLRA